MSTELSRDTRPRRGVATTRVSAVIDDGTEEGRQRERYTIHHEREGDLFVFPQKDGEVRAVRNVKIEEIYKRKHEPKRQIEERDVRRRYPD